MKTETTYSKFDLQSGKCTCCGEQSDEILIDDGRCIDCIEDEKFFDQTMKKKDDDNVCMIFFT